MMKYVRIIINGCTRRLRLIPDVISFLWKIFKIGRPLFKDITRKYEGDFQDVFTRRDPNSGMSLTRDEVYTIYSSVLATNKLKGAVAEVGVFKGGSAKMICEVKGDKALYLFDTFEGMPDEKISRRDNAWPEKTHTGTSLDEVKSVLSEYQEVYFIKGMFPDSIYESQEYKINEQKFSFVHLDVDLYQSTLDALQFFYPRMVTGGRIISHNYNLSTIPGGDTPGVKAAFLEYFKDKEQHIIEIADTQCMVIKFEE